MDFDEEESIRAFMTKARKVAIKRGFPHEAEDFAQEAAVNFWQGRNTTPWNLFTDYLRKNYGHSRSPCGRERMRISRSMLSLQEREVLEPERGAVIDARTLIGDGLDFRAVEALDIWHQINEAKHLTETERNVLNQLITGANLKETGKALGFTESMASQVYGSLKKNFQHSWKSKNHDGGQGQCWI